VNTGDLACAERMKRTSLELKELIPPEQRGLVLVLIV